MFQNYKESDFLLILFDSLFMDYTLINNKIDCEDFKAAISYHDLLKDKEINDQVDKIVKQI